MVMRRERELRKWVRERDEAVASLDVEVFKKFYEKWKAKGVYTDPLPSDDVVEISIYKCALHITSIPLEIKNRAAAWLWQRGYDLDL
jgi:hypothetical protein